MRLVSLAMVMVIAALMAPAVAPGLEDAAPVGSAEAFPWCIAGEGYCIVWVPCGYDECHWGLYDDVIGKVPDV